MSVGQQMIEILRFQSNSGHHQAQPLQARNYRRFRRRHRICGFCPDTSKRFPTPSWARFPVWSLAAKPAAFPERVPPVSGDGCGGHSVLTLSPPVPTGTAWRCATRRSRLCPICAVLAAPRQTCDARSRVGAELSVTDRVSTKVSSDTIRAVKGKDRKTCPELFVRKFLHSHRNLGIIIEFTPWKGAKTRVGKAHPQYKHGERTKEAIQKYRKTMSELQRVEWLGHESGALMGPRTAGRKLKE